jgi:adenosylhomocysteinase
LPVATIEADIRDISLAKEGRRRTEWARRQMPVLRQLAAELAATQPLKGAKVAACAHVTTETAVLLEAVREAGAELSLCASNPLSTQDDVAAYLVADLDVPVFAIKGESAERTHLHLGRCLDAMARTAGPLYVVDDGADLTAALHAERHDILERVRGGTEETTTGIIRIRSLHAEGALRYPVVNVNDAQTKHFFDNRYGTGQNTIDGILRATNTLLAGGRFVVCGYGWCGRGIAARARGMGGRVIVCEVEPVKALEAVMDGFDVMPIEQAAALGDVFVTATGNRGVIRTEHVLLMKDGALLANSGHFDREIDVAGLRSVATGHREARAFVEEYTLPNSRRVYLLAEGRLVGQAAAEASPAAVMDMSFANQLLAVAYLAANDLAPGLYPVPADVDARIAKMKLAAMGIAIDGLTPDQDAYLASWR